MTMKTPLTSTFRVSIDAIVASVTTTVVAMLLERLLGWVPTGWLAASGVALLLVVAYRASRRARELLCEESRRQPPSRIAIQSGDQPRKGSPLRVSAAPA
jgi:hypothetical protein